VSHRLEQLSSAIDRGVREVIARGFSDPRISGLITVTGVRVLPDLSQAIISISVLPAEKQDLTFHGLTSAAAFIRREVGDLINARTMPQLTFKLDTSLKKQAAVFKDLDRVREEIEKEDARRTQADQSTMPSQDQP
jgi:ribosome-binding factor A